MSLEVTDDSTEIEASTPALEVSPTPENVESNEAVGDQTVTAPVTPEVPSYTPSFKYNVRGQEKEIDEMFRGLIKDADSEKKIKELFERAEGLDFVKQDRTALKSEYEGFKQQITPYLQEYHKFTSLRDKGSLGAALQVAGISDDQIFEYALNKIQMEQNPQQAQLYKNHNEASLREIDMEGQLQRYQQMEQSIQQQQFDYNLTAALGAHKDLVSQVEEKWGRPGSFKDEVIAYGIAEYHRGNQNLSEQQAVDAIVNKYKPFLSTPVAPVPVQQQHIAPATMPNVGSSNISSVSRSPKTIADIKKAALEMVE